MCHTDAHFTITAATAKAELLVFIFVIFYSKLKPFTD